MSEELYQRNLVNKPAKIGIWDYYSIGATTLKSLKDHKIIPDVDYKELSKRKPDGLITHKKKVIAVITNKLPTKFKSDKQKIKAIEEWIDVSLKLKCKLIIATDTKNTLWINALRNELIKDEQGNDLLFNFDPDNPETTKIIQKIWDCIDKDNSNLLLPKIKDPTPLSKQVWQDLWSVSGATPENCLYTFVELFIFKYLSDLNVLAGLYSFEHLLSLYETNGEGEVLEYYADTIRKKIKELFPKNEKDNTTVINGTIFVSKDDKAVEGYSGVFKKILEKFHKEGKLENIHYDFKSKVFESFLKESISKKNWGQFFTPLKVVKAIVSMARSEIKEGITVCDPACGVGKFLLEAIQPDVKRFFKVENNKLKRYINIVGYDKGFDRDEQKTIILAKANMLIYMSELIKEHSGLTKQFADLFNDSFFLHTKSILGTLREPCLEKYELILTNPPYVTSGSSNLKEEVVRSGLSSHFTVNALGVEGLFTEWIVRALKPGGKAFIVVPDGILNRQNDKNLRKFIQTECIIDAIISLPQKTFFTTIKKTYILIITRKIDKAIKQNEPVFTYLVNDIGETLDIYRFEIGDNDLNEAVNLYNQFKGSKRSFKTTDSRCKIQPFNKFDPDNHWSIDRWWTENEKIELGIIKEENIMSVEEFSDYIGELSESLNEYQSQLMSLKEKKKDIISYREISLKDKTFFDIFIGKRVLKKDLFNIKGTIPLYSANVNKSIGKVNKSNISDFNYHHILWGIDGNFDFSYIAPNEEFATTDHCGTIRLKSNTLIPEYLLYELKRIKAAYGYDRSLRASLKNFEHIKVRIPIKDGNFDVDTQKYLSNCYTTIDEYTDKLSAFKKNITDVRVATDDGISCLKTLKLSELFDFYKGSPKYTNEYCRNNIGKYPVFSSRTTNNGIIGNIDSYDFDTKCITWTTDGLHAGTVFLREGKFSMTTHCGALVLKDEYLNKIDLEFIYYKLKDSLKKIAIGDSNKRVTVDIIEKLEIAIPFIKDGDFDLQKQVNIARKTQKIAEIKHMIINKVENTEKINIDLINS